MSPLHYYKKPRLVPLVTFISLSVYCDVATRLGNPQ